MIYTNLGLKKTSEEGYEEREMQFKESLVWGFL